METEMKIKKDNDLFSELSTVKNKPKPDEESESMEVDSSSENDLEDSMSDFLADMYMNPNPMDRIRDCSKTSGESTLTDSNNLETYEAASFSNQLGFQEAKKSNENPKEIEHLSNKMAKLLYIFDAEDTENDIDNKIFQEMAEYVIQYISINEDNTDVLNENIWQDMPAYLKEKLNYKLMIKLNEFIRLVTEN